MFDTLTRSVPGFVWTSDADGRIDFVNCAWCEYTGLSSDVSLGAGWMQAVHPDDLNVIEALWPLRANGQNPAYEAQIRFRRRDGRYLWHLVRANPVADGEGRWIGYSGDIHNLIAIQTRDRVQADILQKVVAGEDVQTLLAALCALGEEQLPGSRCTVLLLSEDETEFTGGAAPFLPRELQAMISGTKVGTGVGSCGTAAFEKRDVVSARIATDPLWEGWREAFAALGVKACWSQPVYGTDGRVLATYGFYFYEERAPTVDELESLDILRQLAAVAIDKARTTQALRESEEHYRHTVEHNPQIPWTADPQGRILSVSSRWREATGQPVDSAIGTGWFQALHPNDVDRVHRYWAECLRTGDPADLKYRIRLNDGGYRWVRARATPRRDANGQIVKWYGAVEDIHDLELAHERLRQQADIDDLTRLPNRRSFEDRLRGAIAETKDGASVDLLLIDLSGFRQLNDRFGHEVGDAVLRLFAGFLRACSTEADIIGRIAGDQFALVLRDRGGEATPQRYAGQLARELERRLARSAKTRNLGVRIGCARSTEDDKSDDLTRRAKIALYAAKGDSGHSVRLFSPALQQAIDQRAEQIELARQALKYRLLVPYYQPMIDLTSGKVAGAEALLRIRHPVEGILSPTSVWAALDAPKIGKAITDQILSLVLANLAEWGPWPAQLGSISVNLSTETLMQDGLARSLLQKLDRKALEPHQLTVEITERVLVDELAPGTRQCLEQLQRHGVRVSLDDFGTGFASLTHLQRLPVNEIKIDKSFVNDLGKDSSGTAIVKSMIHLGRNMGVDVVAEGVETAEQAALLKEWGCRFAQGYHFHRPLSASEFGPIWRTVILGAPKAAMSR
ncbi:GGDEF domain-containing phosphodiesterase [Nitratireductor sp. GZWM139]|uniref:GGDEF domain-containing phosphodiesterase n=1 Tax=Nitratireductor sp. GZWM139 TaxID=2950541 RepID=UPI0024BD8C0C|nr:GGDEF domain-containing phosphodiesterase [Nitratireductor sp. GZWM139]MDJ1466134.1 EAL domain-containing protein [Nitratireductor sp. GZWM139]